MFSAVQCGARFLSFTPQLTALHRSGSAWLEGWECFWNYLDSYEMVYPELCTDHHDNQAMNTTDFGDPLTFTLVSQISRLFQTPSSGPHLIIGVDHPSVISTSHPHGVRAGLHQISLMLLV